MASEKWFLISRIFAERYLKAPPETAPDK